MEALTWLARYTSFCAINVSPDGVIKDVQWNAKSHGLEGLAVGDNIGDCEQLVFLHAMPLNQPISLPLITLAENDYIRCEIIPIDKDTTRIYIVDAENESLKQQQLQQKAAALYDALAQKVSLIGELNRLHDELEKQNEEVEKANELKSNFISGMSHEFRSPLATVLGYTGVIEDETTDDNILLACGTIKRAASHVMALIDNILDAAQFEQDRIELSPDDHSIGVIIDQVGEFFVPLAINKNIEFSCDSSIDNSTSYRIDAVRLRQVLINLVSNAIKFTTQGSVRVTAQIEDDILNIRVADTGGGVDAEVAQRLFQPFSRKAHDTRQGAGLGLSIVRYIAQLMGGDVEYQKTDSLGSAGSEFSFTVPVRRSIDTSINTKNQTQSTLKVPVLTGKSIVIVDDDEDVGALTAMLLSQAGALTNVIEDGFAAVDYILENRPDTAIIDYNLPQCTGNQVIEMLRAGGYKGDIVGLSAAGVEVIASMGADRILQKPFSKKQLYKVVSDND